MKKIIFVFFMLSFLTSNLLNAQISKSDKVAFKKNISLTCSITYDDNMNIEDRLFVFTGRDARYRQLISYICIKSGEASIVYDFLIDLKAFIDKFKGENNISTKIDGNSVTMYKMYGLIGLDIYGDDNGYISIIPKDIDYLIKKLKDYCDKNNISYIE